jgi:hypothetical protein
MQIEIFDECGFARDCIYKFDKDKLIIALNSNGKRPKDLKMPEPLKDVDPNLLVAIDNSFYVVTLARAK